jgi:IS5 family transposase
MRLLAQTLRRRTGLAMGEVDRLTGQVAQLAQQTLRDVAAVARNARRALARRPTDGRLRQLVSDLEVTMAATQRLLAQTTQRLTGNRTIPDRLVSLADPDARPIRKGKPRSLTQFGYHSARRRRARLHRHPPGPPGQPGRRAAARARRRARRPGHRARAGHGGRRPRVRDRRPSKARLELERTRRFRRLRNWRVGIEARISQLKRGFGLRRTRLRRLPGAQTWVGLGIFAYNLQRMTVVSR